ncbi:CRIB domain-containing protein RIC6 [Striga hermonthica]|uniref:CRIB domain-containing protein RIC6 n=1 Tax=Striga hermonthica TaxID=68872 RepID=A0A9N7NKA5_STRHE|nr:CRIB domain-containing protein RIC6 [Striga hermonthica]
MATKVKGLFKGLRSIPKMFDDGKEEEMQIGFPTDVKHVAHIGWDGPSQVGSSPSWMKEFKASNGHQSAPLDSNGKIIEGPEIKWVSEDTKKGNRATESPEISRSSRRENNNSNESPRKKDSSTKSRHSRRNHSKDSSEGGSVKSGRDESGRPDSPSRAHPDLAKKSRRKKPKEDGGGSTRSRHKDSDGGSTRSRSKDSDGGSTRSRSKDSDGGSTRSRSNDSVSEGNGSLRPRAKPTSCGASAYSDNGPLTGTIDEEKERRVIS